VAYFPVDEIRFVEPVSEPVEEQSEEPKCPHPSCVMYLVNKGINIPPVSAIWFKDFKLTGAPSVGAIVVQKFGEGELNHHIALVTELGATSFKVDQANKVACQRTEEWIDYNDKTILGFFRP